MNHPQELAKNLRLIFSSLNIFSPTGFHFAGQQFYTQSEPAASAGNRPLQNPMIALLQQTLYLHCYSQRFSGHLADIPAASSDDFIRELAVANRSRERWLSGWQITQTLPSGQVTAVQNGQTRTLWPGEFITEDGPAAPPRPGARIRVFAPKESATMQPGFYFAFGETASESYELANAVRFYWNIDADGARQLMELLTQRFNRFQIPFRFKCSSNRAFYYRIDSAILFVSRRHYQIATQMLRELYPQVQAHLRPKTPLFTQPLAPGLAFAEEPATGESFGMSRCRLLAEGVWSAYMNGSQTQQARWQALQAQFAQNGLLLERPHLRAGSVGCYEWPKLGGESA